MYTIPLWYPGVILIGLLPSFILYLVFEEGTSSVCFFFGVVFGDVTIMLCFVFQECQSSWKNLVVLCKYLSFDIFSRALERD